MKKLTTIITSALLCVAMLALAPAQVIASAAESGGKYISEVKIGMGVTSDEASKELLAEGYTILKDDKGENADLNKDAGADSMKYENGLPILADSLKLKLGKGLAPEGYTTGIHMFGDEAVQNLTDAKSGFCYNDPNEGTYVFYKQDTTPVNGQTAAGSLFSGGSIALGLIVGLLAGGGLMWLLTLPSRKKREKDAA